MKAIWNGVVIAESNDTVVVEGNHYFPKASLKTEFTTFSNHRTSCVWKGQAYYMSLFVNGEMNPHGADAVQHLDGLLHIIHRHALGDFELQQTRRQACFTQDVFERSDKAGLFQLAMRDIHRHPPPQHAA